MHRIELIMIILIKGFFNTFISTFKYNDVINKTTKASVVMLQLTIRVQESLINIGILI